MEPVRRQLRNSVRRSDDDPKSALEKSQESNTASVKTQPQKHAFENETLETILDHLARWYDVDIFYAEQSVKTSRYSMKVERYEHIDEILRRLAQTNHVRFEIKERTIFVYGKGS